MNKEIYHNLIIFTFLFLTSLLLTILPLSKSFSTNRNETSTEIEARPISTGNTDSSRNPSVNEHVLQLWNPTKYENFPAVFYKIDQNGSKKHYITNFTMSPVNLIYEEAQKFCANNGLELASDELELESNNFLKGSTGWINSKVNFSSGELQIANIYKERALKELKIFTSRKILFQRDFSSPDPFVSICAFIADNLEAKIRRNKFICENDPFDETGQVKVFRNCTMNCEPLQLNATFIDKYGLFVRSEEIWHEEKGENKTFVYVGPRSCQSSQMDSGFKIENFNRKETGIPWCSWQEDESYAFVLHPSFGITLVRKSTARAICVAKKFVDSENATFEPFEIPY